MCVQRFERDQPMIATRLGCTNGRALSMALGSGGRRLAGGCAVGVTGRRRARTHLPLRQVISHQLLVRIKLMRCTYYVPTS
jgi:hypothetical protein